MSHTQRRTSRSSRNNGRIKPIPDGKLLNNSWWRMTKRANNNILKKDCLLILYKAIFGHDPKDNEWIYTLDIHQKINITDYVLTKKLITLLLEWASHSAHVWRWPWGVAASLIIIKLLIILTSSLPSTHMTKKMIQNYFGCITNNVWTIPSNLGDIIDKHPAEYGSELLLKLWLRVDFRLDKYFHYVFKFTMNRTKCSLDFVTKCSLFTNRRKEIKSLFEHKYEHNTNIGKDILSLLNGTDCGKNALLLMYSLHCAGICGDFMFVGAHFRNTLEQFTMEQLEPVKKELIQLQAKYGKLYAKYMRVEMQIDTSSGSLNEPSNQLHLWNYSVAAWVPCKLALRKRIKIDKKTKISAISKKFGGLDDGEIVMYQTLANCCNEFHGLEMPHDILMVILIYSQGYKFEVNDEVVCFQSGIFDDGRPGRIREILENENTNYFEYKIGVGRWDARNYVGPRRVPFNHVFPQYLVIINEEEFNKQFYANMRYGDVLKICNLQCIQVQQYSKKKKKNIQKFKVVVDAITFYDESRGVMRRDGWTRRKILNIPYDGSIMLGAKFKQIDR